MSQKMLAGTLVGALAAGFAAPVCRAADTDPVEVLVVTAERREEDPQRVPVSLAVFSGLALDAAGVERTLDLPLVTPGLLYRTNTVFGQPYLRGVGSDLLSAGADSSVATVVDGVYQSRPVASLWELYDVDRVEVLKGPQGTLFGRNATGGVIHIIHNTPQPEFQTGADFVYGNFDKLRLRAFVNAPIVDDRIFARVAGLFDDRKGYMKNLFLGDRIDDEDVWSVRGQVRALASEDVTLHLSGDYTRDRSTRGLASKLGEPFSGSPAAMGGGTVPPDPRKVLFDLQPEADVEVWGVSGRAAWERDAFALSSLTAYRESRLSESLDLDATELDFFSNFPEEKSQTFTQELQLASRGEGPLEWVAGAYYLREDARQILDVVAVPFGIRDLRSSDLGADAVAVYGHASYDLVERWRVSAGLRYSYERRTEDYRETINGGLFARFEQKEDWDAWTPKFSLEYFGADDWMLYASVTRGFKSGGFNSTAAQNDSFDPEFLWSYEVGFKGSLPRDLGRINAAIFYYDYEDIQLQVPPDDPTIPFPLIENAGSATIWGVEAGIVLRPFENASLSFTAAYLNTRFDDLIAVDPNDFLADPDQSGNRLPTAPEFTIGVGAEYAWPLASFATLTPRLEYRYQSEVFFNIYQDDTVRQTGYSLWNARLTLEASNGHWNVALFGRNLGDETYAQNIIRVDGSVGNLFFWGPPRTYGVQVGLRF